MTALAVEPDLSAPEGGALYYKRTVLEPNQDAMVRYLVIEHGFNQVIAHAMVHQFWDRVVNRIVETEGVEHSLAERMLDQALAIIRLLAEERGHSPSKIVDKAWHILLEYSYEFEALCLVAFGKRIYHAPNDVEGFIIKSAGDCTEPVKCDGEGGSMPRTSVGMRGTVTALRLLGPVDDELWPIVSQG